MAHRGLAVQHDENTLESFQEALDAGAHIIETDVRCTRDGIAVLFHDEALPSGVRLQDSLWTAVAATILPRGGAIPTLAQTLAAFPTAKFNIDVKAPQAIEATARAIIAASANDRVLIASFSEQRRSRTVRLVPGVATSATAAKVLLAVIAGKVGGVGVMRCFLKNVDAVQIPEKVLGMTTTTPLMVQRFHDAGVEVHVWTINEETDMIRLREAGVDGVVTDRCDLARRVFTL